MRDYPSFKATFSETFQWIHINMLSCMNCPPRTNLFRFKTIFWLLFYNFRIMGKTEKLEILKIGKEQGPGAAKALVECRHNTQRGRRAAGGGVPSLLKS